MVSLVASVGADGAVADGVRLGVGVGSGSSSDWHAASGATSSTVTAAVASLRRPAAPAS
jgi:hypothetical protein